MRQQYDFHTSTFAINKKEIHLLKNNEAYKVYNVDSVSEITVFYGKELRNWIIGVITGASMLAFGLYYTWLIIKHLFVGYDIALTLDNYIVAFPPLFVGAFLLFISFRKSMIVAFKTPTKLLYISLRDLMKSGQLDEFYRYLKQHFQKKIVAIPN